MHFKTSEDFQRNHIKFKIRYLISFSSHICLICLCTFEFSQTHKVGNVGIIDNVVLEYICSFLLSSYQLLLANVKKINE